ncbi:opine metallophore biosynthesis dehydrogenase [Tumebacillus sp. DT12]|uniref:Opine metallophore biosynthesis dehydrogenase n=1 Tax=Tumebacillus lacus TaxID=2995335 RepID=A0ABT3X5Y0_9BACL|nr:opine metallophore biosynthesis dehydrogenase [Tumebacillus lacus]MCX7570985.1 opine metallophore biosynthesis dehydrogenase [Tumebacillus lacus]
MKQSFGNTLIIGAGPAALHVAVDVSRGWHGQLGMANRKGAHTDQILHELERSGNRVRLEAKAEKFQHLAAEATLMHFYEGFDEIDDIWETVIVCTPSDSYIEVVDALQLHSLNAVKRVLLLSPGIGSNLLVQSRLGEARDRIEVISFSTYYAATKCESVTGSLLTSSIKGLKRKVYVASNKKESTSALAVQTFLENVGVQCEVLRHPIEAECRSITTYVHPPLFLSEFSLGEIFKSVPSRKYMYKLYPEGPITQHVIRSMRLLWEEVSALVRAFDAQPLNLLKFLNDDNYPVHEVTLSRDDVEQFESFDPVKQEYLLYVRYSSILIDPFSEPDEQGRYFEFSAVPYKQVHKDKDGNWVIPRIPYEDYKRLKLLHGLGEKVNVPMPETARLISLFEAKLREFMEAEGREKFRPDLFEDTTAVEVAALYQERGARR